jgi:hypothetical protein
MSLKMSASSDIEDGTCIAYGEVGVLIEEDSDSGSDIRIPLALRSALPETNVGGGQSPCIARLESMSTVSRSTLTTSSSQRTEGNVSARSTRSLNAALRTLENLWAQLARKNIE